MTAIYMHDEMNFGMLLGTKTFKLTHAYNLMNAHMMFTGNLNLARRDDDVVLTQE